MNLIGGHIYKHKNCLDMHLYIVKRVYSGPLYGKYKVLYVDNRGNPYVDNLEIVKIKHNDINNWKHVGDWASVGNN